MTAIVGAELPGKGVIIGADSESTHDNQSVIRTEPKVIRLDDRLIFAGAGPIALGQLAEEVWYNWIRSAVLAHALKNGTHRRLVRSMVDALRVAAREAGLISRAPDGCEHFDGTTFLVGIGDQLWNINSWQAVYRRTGGLDAMGCGGPVALGALSAQQRWTSEQPTKGSLAFAIIEALKIAAEYCAGVKAPFTYLTTIQD